MNNLVLINNKELKIKEFNGNRVVTFKDIDILHERVSGTAGRNFRENSKHFIEDIDFYFVKPSDIQTDEIRRSEINNAGTYLITESGYLMLVKSLSDDLAWDVQRKLINSYFRVQDITQSLPKLTPMDQLKLQYQVLEEHENKLISIGSKVENLENTMTIDYAQQEELNTLAKQIVIKTLGGKDAPAYKILNRKAFSTLWRDFKRIMQVNSYKNTAVKQFQNAKNLIVAWEPNKDLSLMILGANSQQIMRCDYGSN